VRSTNYEAPEKYGVLDYNALWFEESIALEEHITSVFKEKE
jgi:hypothetical protein